MKKLLVFLLIVLFAITLNKAITSGKENKNSYINDVNFSSYLDNSELKVWYIPYPFDEDYDIYGEGNNVQSLSDLDKVSAVIVKARLNPEFIRQIYYECVLSEIEILEVYKGDLEVGGKINIFEPVNCTFKTTMISPHGYIPMQSNEEYLLFLMPLKNSLFGEADYVYLPSTITYSKYKFDNSEPRIFTQEALEREVAQYSEIKHEELYLYDEKIHKLFVDIKNAALEKYK